MSSIGYSYGSIWIGHLGAGRATIVADRPRCRPLLPRFSHGVNARGQRWYDVTWLGMYAGLYGLDR